MSRTLRRALLVLPLIGCGGSVSDRPVDTGPLTVDAWRELPVDLKYDETTFERLREADPKLTTEPGWETFTKEVIIPERKKDGLGIPGARIP